MAVDVTRMTTSVGSSIFGSGTSLTFTSRLPCQVTAFIAFPSPSDVRTRPYPNASSPCASIPSVASHLTRLAGSGCPSQRFRPCDDRTDERTDDGTTGPRRPHADRDLPEPPVRRRGRAMTASGISHFTRLLTHDVRFP